MFFISFRFCISFLNVLWNVSFFSKKSLLMHVYETPTKMEIDKIEVSYIDRAIPKL